MTRTLFTDPYSGHEVLCLDPNGFSCGATYDPRLTSSLYPWKSSCPHCQKGRSGDIPSHIRRHIEMLCTRRRGAKDLITYQLTLDRSGDVYLLEHSRKGDEQKVDVLLGSEIVAQVRKQNLEDRIVEGDLRSKILSRATRFLMSARPADLRLVEAISHPLADLCDERRKKPGRRPPCYDIDWQGVMQALSK